MVSPEKVECSSAAGALAAEVQAEAAGLAADHGGELPPWLRYVDSEQEEERRLWPGES